MKDDVAPRPWYEEIVADFTVQETPAQPESHLDPEHLPEWVQKVMIELTQQSGPGVPIRHFGKPTPRKVGQWLGQNCANSYAIADHLQGPLTAQMDTVTPVLRQLEDNRQLPGVESLLKVFELGSAMLESFNQSLPAFQAKLPAAFQRALAQPDHTEALEFFQGFAHGMARKGLEAEGLALATTATALYLKLYVHWQEVDRLPNVTALREFLLKSGLPESVLGSPERLQQFCHRLGLKLGRRGRPRKANKSDTPSS